MHLEEKIKNLPSYPGVYLMKDSLNSIIYIGKSKNLKSRVSSYFQKSKSHSPKVLKLINHLKDFDFVTTDTEFEALLLECKLIKEIKPLYNRLMKNPKSYCYIALSLSDTYPYIKLSREYVKGEGPMYFGPFTNKRKVKKAIFAIKYYLKILCISKPTKGMSCLNHSLGLCSGMCLKDYSKEDFIGVFNSIVDIVEGKDKKIVNDLEIEMKSYSSKLDFENAIKFRDYIDAINYVIAKNKVIEFTKENKNILVIEPLDENQFKLFLIKGNLVLFGEKYSCRDFDPMGFKDMIKEKSVEVFYQYRYISIDIGRDQIDESQIIYTYLKDKDKTLISTLILDSWVCDINNLDFDKEIGKVLSEVF